MLDASVDCIKVMSPQGEIRHINQSACHKLGLILNSSLPAFMVKSRLKLKTGQRALKQAAQGLNSRFVEKAQTEDQYPEYWDHLLTPVLDENNIPQNILCFT